ncbi:fibroblast growth factor receptor 3-like [Ptychodera flava]|uniref:fibroblast growth factor receptor 3-like n=1 Tax=Ptychodera flava TaxID=63121 RepID=UPI00396A0949
MLGRSSCRGHRRTPLPGSDDGGRENVHRGLHRRCQPYGDGGMGGRQFCGQQYESVGFTEHPPTVSTEKRAEIVVGRSLTLSCSVASGNPANANIHWILLNGDRQPGSTLPLTDVTRDMAGNYTCEATNTFYDNTQGVGRSTTYLDVHFEPTVQRSHFSDEVEADIGVNATLVCVMSASPSPTFVWQKDGQQITTSSEETIEGTETTSKLIVAFVTKEDYGDYVIEQSEEQGTSLGAELKHIGKDNDDDKGHYQDLEFTESEKESNYTSLESQYTSLRQPATDTADIYMKLGARSNDFPRQHIKVHELIGTGSYGQINGPRRLKLLAKAARQWMLGSDNNGDSASDDDKRRLTVELKHTTGTRLRHHGVHGSRNLLKNLRDYRRDKTSDYANAARLKWVLKSKDLVSMGKQIAAGMQYLASKSHHTRQPIRWFSPETVSSGEYSTMSDVWSFGVVLWEITTLGKTPYPTAKNVTKVREFISKGFRMKRPAYCDAKLYSVMTRCWSENKTERPSFSKLVIELEGMAKSSEVFIDVKKACADTPDYKRQRMKSVMKQSDGTVRLVTDGH